VISFQRERLRQLADAIQIDISLDRQVTSKPAWDSPVSHRLSRWLEQIHPVMAPGAETHDFNGGFHDEKLGLAILRILVGEDWRARDENRTQHARLLRRSLEILDDHQNLPIGVTELCQAVGTSLSTLGRVFTASFDMTPKAYIRARCLSAVRDQLGLAPPGTRIVDVANRWGFWHMGQFARDYRRMFGELPSETRNKFN
jgi:AraC-like DNA-binding protein